jgi:alpha-1,6-mannosyltransferase
MLILTMVGHVVLTPYTKVEETFQINNIYDNIYLMTDTKNYDFKEFFGVVERTFISSLMIAIPAFPFKYILPELGLSTYYMLILSK